MYKLGILKKGDTSQHTFVDEIMACSNIKTSVFNCVNNNEETLSEMNIILIDGSPTFRFESICESILELRKTFQGVIWILSEEISGFNQMIYYQLGADGISNVDINKEIFLLQLENLLKHTSSKEEIKEEPKRNTTHKKDFILNEGSLSLTVKDGFEISLTKLEFLVVRELFIHRGETLTYEEIYEKIWVDKKNGTTADAKFRQYRITNIIFHLRKKFETAPGKPEYIKTVRSKGYKLDLK
ncbi:winged helix-turn-helix domain-containing protein [Enterococcus rotai]|uniref:winged helix-turn-helix domain-containing protein n=1 Tax=Enterococcus rotai TaxID=118060 RepID=UPI0035C754E3